MMADNHECIKVIYILGEGRSGSTLLDMVLGTHSQIESIGELNQYKYYFSDLARKPHKERICACGKHLDLCPYWEQIVKSLQIEFDSNHLSLSPQDGKNFERKNQVVLNEILNLSGKEWICDSSKRLSRLRAYLKSDLFDIFIIHLIRDSRAVSNSGKGKTNIYRKVYRWTKNNLIAYFKLRNSPNYYLLSYEEFVKNPEEILQNMLACIELNFEPTQLENWGNHPSHNLGGNPMRFQKQKIVMDQRYLTDLSKLEWFLLSIFSFPGLRCFGYPFSRKKTATKFISPKQ